MIIQYSLNSSVVCEWGYVPGTHITTSGITKVKIIKLLNQAVIGKNVTAIAQIQVWLWLESQSPCKYCWIMNE